MKEPIVDFTETLQEEKINDKPQDPDVSKTLFVEVKETKKENINKDNNINNISKSLQDRIVTTKDSDVIEVSQTAKPPEDNQKSKDSVIKDKLTIQDKPDYNETELSPIEKTKLNETPILIKENKETNRETKINASEKEEANDIEKVSSKLEAKSIEEAESKQLTKEELQINEVVQRNEIQEKDEKKAVINFTPDIIENNIKDNVEIQDPPRPPQYSLYLNEAQNIENNDHIIANVHSDNLIEKDHINKVSESKDQKEDKDNIQNDTINQEIIIEKKITSVEIHDPNVDKKEQMGNITTNYENCSTLNTINSFIEKINEQDEDKARISFHEIFKDSFNNNDKKEIKVKKEGDPKDIITTKEDEKKIIQFDNIINIASDSKFTKIEFHLTETNNDYYKDFKVLQNDTNMKVKNDNIKFWTSKNLFNIHYFEFVQDIMINYNTLYNQINEDLIKNQNYLTEITNIENDKKIFASSYITIKSLSEKECESIEKMCTHEFQFVIFKFTLKFFLTILLRAKKRSLIPMFVHLLKYYINKSIQNAAWIIEEFTDFNLIKELLIDCPLSDMKKLVCGLLYCAMIKVTKDLQGSYCTNENFVLEKLIRTLLVIVYSKPEVLNCDFTYLYLLIWRFNSLGFQFQQYLVKKGIIGFILRKFQYSNGKLNEQKKYVTEEISSLKNESYLGLSLLDKSESLNEIEQNQERKLKEKVMNNVSRNYLLLLIVDILISYSSKTGENNDLIENLSGEEQALLKFEMKDFWKAIIIEVSCQQDALLVSKLIYVLSYNNLERINPIHSVIMDLLIDQDSHEIEKTLKIFKNFLLIEDNFHELKVKLP